MLNQPKHRAVHILGTMLSSCRYRMKNIPLSWAGREEKSSFLVSRQCSQETVRQHLLALFMPGIYVKKKTRACNIQEQALVDNETLTNKSEAAFPTQLHLILQGNYGPFLRKPLLHKECQLA